MSLAHPSAAAQAGRWLRAGLAAGANLSADSRRVQAGDGFLACPGERVDGRDFVVDAIERGAAAIVYDPRGRTLPALPVPSCSVAGLRDRAGEVASVFYGTPSARVPLVAVTGTNGKTSCTQWIARGLAQARRPAAVVGTLGAGLVGGPEDEAGLTDFGLTTPDAVTLQRMLAGFVAAGAGAVALEASSIGIEQGRLAGTRIATAVFTNLSRDHLDFHGDMQAYAHAKRRLFGWCGLQAAVVNGDDPQADAILGAVEPGVRTIAYGLSPGTHGARAREMLRAGRVDERRDGIEVDLDGDFGAGRVRLSLLGRFNVSNALAAAGAWLASGLDFDAVRERLERIRPVPGRMQQVVRDGRPLAVIDYAHSPDALEKVLAALRPVAAARGGRLWCLFGAGGDRDRGKRAPMAAAVERGADLLAITSDNPRSEPPERILADLRAGLTLAPWLVEPDRARAIGRVLGAAGADDVVLIAGKGHEPYQEVDGKRLPFSDLAHARAALDSALSEASS